MSNPAPGSSAQTLNPTHRSQIILIAVLRLVLNTGYRMVYPYLPVFARSLGVEVGSVSLALSARSLLAAFGPFLATIADTRGRKIGMIIGVAIFTLGCILVVIWPTFLLFALAFLLITLGKSIFDPSMHAYAGDVVPYRQRATAIAIIEMSWSLSFILGIPLMGILIDYTGWTSPFTLLAFLGVATLFVLQRYLPTSQNPRPATSALRPPFYQNLSLVFRHGPAVAAILLSVLSAAANESINIIFGVWIADLFGVQLAALGAASAVIGLSELSGEGLVGFFTDRLGKTRAIGLGLILNCLSALILPLLDGSLALVFSGLFFFYITFEFTLVSTIPLVTEILPGARATLLATTTAAFSVGRSAGAALAAPLYGFGIWANSAAAVAFNLLALLALAHLARRMRGSRETSTSADHPV